MTFKDFTERSDRVNEIKEQLKELDAQIAKEDAYSEKIYSSIEPGETFEEMEHATDLISEETHRHNGVINKLLGEKWELEYELSELIEERTQEETAIETKKVQDNRDVSEVLGEKGRELSPKQVDQLIDDGYDLYVPTNMGHMPVRDYMEIQAYQAGFDSYGELRKKGYSIEISTDSLVTEEKIPVYEALEIRLDIAENMDGPELNKELDLMDLDELDFDDDLEMLERE